jgi:hypothetical protein
MFTCQCDICGATVTRKVQTKAHYCTQECKAEAQRRSKPVDRDWLYQKYIVEGLDCTQIAALVQRNSKRVWEWLRDYDIPTRGRGTTGNGKHTKGGKRNIAPEVRKKLSDQARARVLAMVSNGGKPFQRKDGTYSMKGRTGAAHPTWRGGATPERAKVYGSPEWKAAVKAVWARDNATCQRCGKHHNTAAHRGTFDIHHIVSFAVAELRCEASNLVLLCEPCHLWVHSSNNVNGDFIKEVSL